MDKRKPRTLLCLGLTGLLLSACGEFRPPGSNQAVVYHTVKAGDTLYSIAWHYGYDYRQVAAWNGIGAPYRIFIGQQLRLIPPYQFSGGRFEGRERPTETGTIVRPVRQEEGGGRENRDKGHEIASLAWRWPVRGDVIRTFSVENGRKGVDIGGQPGQPVVAAAVGDVVYSGSGLIGYGQLVIIKHDNTYLSAYAHNRKLLVKEGDRVSAGQQIAEMGQTAGQGSILHFEIRRDGKPVDPLNYLPKERL